MIDFLQLSKIISENKSFLLTTHVNPDADAIGSELAFYRILKKLGKTARIVNHSETPYILLFLDTDSVVEKYEKEKHDMLFYESDVIVALDFNSSQRVASMQMAFENSKKLKICIDHHPHPSPFADHFFVDSSYSATGHVLYDFIKKTNIVVPDKSIAIPIYAAIMTDTGSFRFDKTTADLHRLIAELIDLGADPTYIYDKIYDESRYSKIRLLGECLSTIRMTPSKEIAYIVITQQALKISGADEADIDGFVNYCLSIKGVKMGLLFFELENGLKVSLRSKGSIPVNLLAEEFGGGGHLNASGIRVSDVKLNDFISIILEAAERYIK
jgi:phosphoesterase RecJ-like protein